MKDRITLLIKAKNLTAAQFADEIGVQKSSISHILSGRNNASLDFIQKILLCYPDVSMEWLMFGKGPIFKSSIAVTNLSNDKPLQAAMNSGLPPVDLFSELNPDNASNFGKEDDLSLLAPGDEIPKTEDIKKTPRFSATENPGSNLSSADINPESRLEKPENLTNKFKTILKIVEFYSDNTYHEYFPE